jgi:hypothetical protein
MWSDVFLTRLEFVEEGVLHGEDLMLLYLVVMY